MKIRRETITIPHKKKSKSLYLFTLNHKYLVLLGNKQFQIGFGNFTEPYEKRANTGATMLVRFLMPNTKKVVLKKPNAYEQKKNIIFIEHNLCHTKRKKNSIIFLFREIEISYRIVYQAPLISIALFTDVI